MQTPTPIDHLAVFQSPSPVSGTARFSGCCLIMHMSGYPKTQAINAFFLPDEFQDHRDAYGRIVATYNGVCSPAYDGANLYRASWTDLERNFKPICK